MERGVGTSPSELLKVLYFHFPWQPCGLLFSFLLQGVRVCWVWDKERRGGCSLAWLRQPGDRGWVRKSILDTDWPFTYDRESRIPVLGVYIISERLRLLHCAVWRLKWRFKHLPVTWKTLVTTGWSIRTVFVFFFKQIDGCRAAFDSQANRYTRFLCVCVFVCSI